MVVCLTGSRALELNMSDAVDDSAVTADRRLGSLLSFPAAAVDGEASRWDDMRLSPGRGCRLTSAVMEDS